MSKRIDFDEIKALIEQSWLLARDCKLAGCNEALVTQVPPTYSIVDSAGNRVTNNDQVAACIYGNVRSTLFWKLIDKLVPSVARLDHQTHLPRDPADKWKDDDN